VLELVGTKHFLEASEARLVGNSDGTDLVGIAEVCQQTNN